MRIGTRASVAHSMVPRSSGRRRTLGPTNSHNESAPPSVVHFRACRRHMRHRRARKRNKRAKVPFCTGTPQNGRLQHTPVASMAERARRTRRAHACKQKACRPNACTKDPAQKPRDRRGNVACCPCAPPRNAQRRQSGANRKGKRASHGFNRMRQYL